MSLLEALSYGNQCLVSNIPENTEVITKDCYTFEKSNVNDLANKLIEILNLNVNTHQKFMQVYSWDDVVNRTLDLYER